VISFSMREPRTRSWMGSSCISTRVPYAGVLGVIDN
jgi:hypothetical protein